jgi:1,4-alpha-glucan branching enzyme
MYLSFLEEEAIHPFLKFKIDNTFIFMKLSQSLFYLFIVSGLLSTSCSNNNNGGDVIDTYVAGMNYNPKAPDADQALTITYVADASSALYGYKGDVYLHTGVVDGVWKYVPANWTTNLDKCKMTSIATNTWQLKMSSSIRDWYGSGTTGVQKLGFVLRSSDGTKQTDNAYVTVTDSKYGFTPAAIIQKAMPQGVTYGVNVNADNTVTLVLYDVDKSGNHKDYCYVEGDFNDWTLSNDTKSQMYRDNTAGCWWITLSSLNASKEYAYQYYIGDATNGSTRIADPYTTKILDPDNDKYIAESTYPSSLLTYPSKASGIVSTFKMQKDSYSWQSNFSIADLDENNLTIYEMLFRDFTSSGDINGAIQKLDYLKTLGVNAVELMPVQEFDGNDSWGYNPCFYFALDKAYGTPTMYKEFIDACHNRGMAVLFDVVFNQATGNFPYAQLYWDATNSKPASNNPWFNVDAPHPYSVFCDFNHTSPCVRNYFKRNLQYLLDEYHVDGFRFDLAKGFTQTPSTESNVSNYDASRVANLKYYIDAVKAKNANAMPILELFTDKSEETALANDGAYMWRNMNNAYCQSGMGWKDSSSFTDLFTSGNSGLDSHWVGYMESHDEERVSYKQVTYGNYTFKTSLADRMSELKDNAAFFFTVPGPKMMWQFGELGYDISIDQNGRTGKKPLHWEYFDDSNRKAVYTTYSKLMQLRNSNDDLFNPASAVVTWKASASDWDAGRTLVVQNTTKSLVVAGNFTNNAVNVSVTFPFTGVWYNYIDGTQITVSSTTQTISIPAFGYKLYVNFD